jgi:hypothetical protein
VVPGVITVDKPSVEPGGDLVVKGTGCDAGATVTVAIGGQVIGTTVADANGHFSTSVSVGNVAVGRHVLTAQCGPTLTTTIDVVLTTRVLQGASTAIVIILFIMLALGLFLSQYGKGRRV